MYEENVFNTEDALCRAFVMALGSELPSQEAVKNIISWVNLQAQKENERLTTDYVYSCIPRYITFLFNKS